MLSKELLQLLRMSGGKIILSKGDPKDSYVIMELSQHLKEFGRLEKECGLCCEDVEYEDDDFLEEDSRAGEPAIDLQGGKKFSQEPKSQDLTNQELLDRINADIAQLRQRNTELELEREFEVEKNNDKEDKYSYEELRF